MAKKENFINQDDNENNEIIKNWREGDLIQTFKIIPIRDRKTALMEEWLNAPKITLDIAEKAVFDKILKRAISDISGWNEEDLKMKFIAYILDLGLMNEGVGIVSYFDKTISANVEGTKLVVKSDFMLAKGVLDAFRTPYFHFQEYKPNKNPKGDPMAQLLEAFLIAQVKNKNDKYSDKPLYGVEVIGENWKFVVMEKKEYCISKAYNAIIEEDLVEIIAILRKFKEILVEKLFEKD